MADRAFDIKGWFSQAGEEVGRLLFPPSCLGCRAVVGVAGSVCPRCWTRIRFIERPWCEVLGIPLAGDVGEGNVSPDAIASPPPYARARAAVSYVGAARQMAQNLKYRDRTDLAPWMAQWMLRAGSELLTDADLIVPVPLHRRRFFMRRFNQSAELARHIATVAGLTYAPDMIVRNRLTRQQVGLKAREREENVRGAFEVPARHRAALSGKRVLLVDDVLTTGATVTAVTRAIVKGGARSVDVLTFARAIPGDFLPDEQETI